MLEVETGEIRSVSGNGLVSVLWQSRCTVSGGPRGDELRGTRATDVICGLHGGDRIRGGAGVDRPFGHRGDDRIDARDGGFDVVGCGGGRDFVAVDRRDLAGVDCERVLRAG